jgi:hypothetical protein
MKAKITKDGYRTYNVIGKSGNSAGYIQRVGTPKRYGWLVCLLSSPTEVYETFASAKREALTNAERY